MKKQKLPIILQEKVNGIDIDLVGVIHNKEFFNKNKNLLKENADNAPAIFIEDGERGRSIENGFYGEIAKFAQEAGKPIYIPDTSKTSYLLPDAVQLTIGISLFANSFGKPKKDFSRRDFLKKSGKGLAGLYLMLGSPLSIFLESPKRNEHIIIDDALKYGVIHDYRNLVSAANIDKLTKKVQFQGKVPYFIGQAHVKGISAYLNNPKLRERKRHVYALQDLIIDSSIKKYEFQDDSWNVTETIE